MPDPCLSVKKALKRNEALRARLNPQPKVTPIPKKHTKEQQESME